MANMGAGVTPHSRPEHSMIFWISGSMFLYYLRLLEPHHTLRLSELGMFKSRLCT